MFHIHKVSGIPVKKLNHVSILNLQILGEKELQDNGGVPHHMSAQQCNDLVNDADHVGGGGAPAALGEGELRARASEARRAPGRDDLRPRVRAVPGLLLAGGPVEERGERPGQHVTLAPAPPRGAPQPTVLRNLAAQCIISQASI